MKYFIREYSWWSTHRTAVNTISAFIFTIAIIIVGVMVVCFTEPKQLGMIALFYIFHIQTIYNFKGGFARITGKLQIRCFHCDFSYCNNKVIIYIFVPELQMGRDS